MKKPRIINGVCEHCGVKASTCVHYKASIDSIEENGNKIITPQNYNKTSKKLLFSCVDFSNLTGMPMYLYNLGKELIKLGYEINLVSTIGGDIADMAREAGFKLFDWKDDYNDDYMALVLNEPISEVMLSRFPDVPAYNIIHSARPEDEPIPDCPQIRKYLYSKNSDLEYIKGKVPDKKIEYLPIPIDSERFNPNKRIAHKRYTILAPCTIDQLRKPMLLDLINRARNNPDIVVIVKGADYGALNDVPSPDNFFIDPVPSKNIEEAMAIADEVAGILFGTVTLEAWAMGLETSVYDLEGKYEMVEPDGDFEFSHEARLVAKSFDEILKEKWADIIIPHHDQPDLLAQTLKSIPIRNYNVIIVRGGYFSESCRRGAHLAQTQNLIFANDDLIIGAKALWEMIDNDADIVGIKQIYPDGSDLCVGIFINEFGNYELTSNKEKAQYPSGALFKISRTAWDETGGLDLRFINGGEDQDLFLKCLEDGFSVGFVETTVVHYCSQSSGRFDHIERNDNWLFRLWTEERLEKVLGKNYKKSSDIKQL